MEKDSRQDLGKPAKKPNWYGKKDTWSTKEEALKGVPRTEREEYGQSHEDCWRCSQGSHKIYKCLAFNIRKGTMLSPAPWKAAAIAG